MLALLLHGIIPHHHHTAEAEKCNLEAQCPSLHHTEKGSTLSVSEVCPDERHANEQQVHACNLNVAASKQISLTLFVIPGNTSFSKKEIQPEVHFLQYSEQLIPSASPEVRSMRAPPLA